MTHPPRSTPTLFDRIGYDRLREVVEDFVDRLYADNMIGFFFAHFDRDRLVLHETQFNARALGADLAYQGRPIGAAHARHRIMGGQFNRRLTILIETMQDHGVDPEVQRRLVEHTERLRGLVTNQPADTCVSESTGGPLLSSWTPEKP